VIFDADLKAWLAAALARLEAPVTLPLRLALPAGAYAINGVVLTVPGGGLVEHRVEVRGQALQLTQLELGLGGSAVFGSTVQHQLPAPSIRAALTRRLGAAVLGVVGSWNPRPYTRADGTIAVAVEGLEGGVLVAAELPDTQPLVVRPGLTWRYGRIGGVALDCGRGEPRFKCGEQQPTELLLYAVGATHTLGGELFVAYHDRTRRSGLGVGIRLGGDLVLGTHPETATADLSNGIGTVDYRVYQRGFSALGLAAMLDVTYAL